ncbi:diphthine--ammonia ligase isoform 2-T3 [Odontesthes bonariensis]
MSCYVLIVLFFLESTWYSGFFRNGEKCAVGSCRLYFLRERGNRVRWSSVWWPETWAWTGHNQDLASERCKTPSMLNKLSKVVLFLIKRQGECVFFLFFLFFPDFYLVSLLFLFLFCFFLSWEWEPMTLYFGSVAPLGLDPEKHLGKSLADVEPYLKQLSQKYGVHICGEGGEYETSTLDCPLFKKKIVIDLAETVIHSADAFAPVGYLRFTNMHTENKDSDVAARALPHGSCPCQSAIDKMTEEVKYADQVEDNQHKFTSNCDLSCQWGHDIPPSCSSRSSRGYQWISGINGLQSQDPGIESQTLAAFTLLQNELESRSWKMKDIILVHLYVRNMEDFVSLNAVYKKHFDINPPARVCVQAPLPAGQLLQMDCLLHGWTEPLEEGCFKQREALHVQSLSHWAPANIGPYSQALRVDEVVFCAGQIALVPCTMELVKAGTCTQAQLSFSHVQKVLEAVISGLTLAHVVQAHCYTTRRQDIGMIRAVWESMLRATGEEKDFLWESEIESVPLLIVVVPALPKDATVELHVTATKDERTRRTSAHVTKKLAFGSIECHTVLSADGDSGSLSLSLEVPGDGLEVVDVKHVTEELGTTFMKAMNVTDAELVPLCARVFYKCSHSLAQQIVQGLEHSLRSSLAESSPSVALVPVLDMPDSKILHLSCWLSL